VSGPQALEDIKEKLLKEQDKNKKLTEEINKKDNYIRDIENKIKEMEKKQDVYLRALADFDNMRKIWEKREKEIKEYATKDLISSLLPLLDTLDAAFRAYKDKNLSVESKEILEGMRKIYTEFIHILNNAGLNEISSVGKKFNPYEHEVVMTEETDKFPEGTIIEEFQKGYKFKDMLLRPSKVKIAKSKNEWL